MSYWVVGAMVIASVGTTVYQGQQQKKMQKEANALSEKNAAAALDQAQQDAAAKNMALPDTASMLGQALLSSRAGPAGTMLTGAGGVSPDKLKLSRNTLLGG